ncbi:MAG TPA: hypothetical protein VJ914_28930 [Pseudonocardiaceae bacterium]|nr:hypothetical protein [Pseudonocardiaceae bacterium]
MSESKLTREQMVATLVKFDHAMATLNLQEMREVVAPAFAWHIPGSHPLSSVTIGPEEAIDRCRSFAPFRVKSEFVSLNPTGPLSLEIVVRDTGSHNGKTLDVTLNDKATFSAEGKLFSLTSGQDEAAIEQANAYFG